MLSCFFETSNLIFSGVFFQCHVVELNNIQALFSLLLKVSRGTVTTLPMVWSAEADSVFFIGEGGGGRAQLAD